jgi:tRNA A37 threonylcarbamoyladenosine biosynthesis protein TsaE
MTLTQDTKTPVTVLTGYLGSGKTTFSTASSPRITANAMR